MSTKIFFSKRKSRSLCTKRLQGKYLCFLPLFYSGKKFYLKILWKNWISCYISRHFFTYLEVAVVVKFAVVSEMETLQNGINFISPDGVSHQLVVAVWFHLPEHLPPGHAVVAAVQKEGFGTPVEIKIFGINNDLTTLLSVVHILHNVFFWLNEICYLYVSLLRCSFALLYPFCTA